MLDDALDEFCTPGNAADVDGVVPDLDAESANLIATEKRRALPDAPWQGAKAQHPLMLQGAVGLQCDDWPKQHLKCWISTCPHGGGPARFRLGQ